MIVRIATKADSHAIRQFQIAMAFETENITLDEEIVKKGVDAVFNDPAKGKYYVAEVNGTVIASLLTTFEWSDWRNGTVIWLQSVFVLKEHRQKGVFSSMYQYIFDLVQNDPKLKGIRLYVDKNNMQAQKVYTKLEMNAEHYQLFEWLKD